MSYIVDVITAREEKMEKTVTATRLEMSQFLILIVTIAGLFLWQRSESRSDFRELSAGVNAQIQAIQDEMKDFHGRLCKIESERQKRWEY